MQIGKIKFFSSKPESTTIYKNIVKARKTDEELERIERLYAPVISASLMKLQKDLKSKEFSSTYYLIELNKKLQKVLHEALLEANK
jgi:hypothetical protein